MKPTSSDMERAREIFNIMNCIGMGYTERQANADVYLIAQAIADEREACANVADKYADNTKRQLLKRLGAECVATAIRKRVSK
jgi:protein-arginine kinase